MVHHHRKNDNRHFQKLPIEKKHLIVKQIIKLILTGLWIAVPIYIKTGLV